MGECLHTEADLDLLFIAYPVWKRERSLSISITVL